MHARGQVSLGLARGGVSKIKVLQTVQYPFEPFVERVWELRDNLSVYDSWYVALAESLGTTLVTADRRLAHAAGPRCPVLAVSQYTASVQNPTT
jgi:predicted nucleic acid-binding protein